MNNNEENSYNEVSSIAVAEEKLSILIDTDKKAWVKMYLLLNEIETKELWKATYPKFGTWLKHYAKEKNINEALLWHRRQAGRFYARYAARAAANHKQVPSIESISIPPDSLNIAERIACQDEAAADELIDKLRNKEMTRQELLSVWGRVRAEKNAEKERRYLGRSYEEPTPKGPVKAKDIYMLLSKDGWMPEPLHIDSIMVERGYHSELPDERKFSCTYRTASMFPVRLDCGTRDIKYIDLLVLENYSVPFYDKVYELRLHAFKVATTPEELHQENFFDYYPLVSDYAWIAVPEDLGQMALETSPEEFGVLTVHSDKVTTEILRHPSSFEDDNSRYKLQTISTFTIQYKYQ